MINFLKETSDSNISISMNQATMYCAMKDLGACIAATTFCTARSLETQMDCWKRCQETAHTCHMLMSALAFCSPHLPQLMRLAIVSLRETAANCACHVASPHCLECSKMCNCCADSLEKSCSSVKTANLPSGKIGITTMPSEKII